jgi:hypothetical protein
MNPSTNQTTSGSPDYYNQCDVSGAVGVPVNWTNYQAAYDGGAYAGLYLFIGGVANAREYVEAPLNSPLTAGVEYNLEMFVNLSNRSQFTTYEIGAYFSKVAITGVNNYFPLPYTPQIKNPSGVVFDTLSWTKVSGSYTASGGEAYLVIGNFDNDANTWTSLFNPSASFNHAYVLIDGVTLVPANPSQAGNAWQGRLDVRLVPNPSAGEISLILPPPCPGRITIEVLDVQGRIIHSHSGEPAGQPSAMELGLGAAAPGIYVVRVISGIQVTSAIAVRY